MFIGFQHDSNIVQYCRSQTLKLGTKCHTKILQKQNFKDIYGQLSMVIEPSLECIICNESCNCIYVYFTLLIKHNLLIHVSTSSCVSIYLFTHTHTEQETPIPTGFLSPVLRVGLICWFHIKNNIFMIVAAIFFFNLKIKINVAICSRFNLLSLVEFILMAVVPLFSSQST